MRLVVEYEAGSWHANEYETNLAAADSPGQAKN